MDINASIDVGKNITGLIEKLAHQIGITADKVFPWYVKQQVIEGWSFIIISSLLNIIFAITFIYNYKNIRKKDDDKYIMMSIFIGLILTATISITSFDFNVHLNQIFNPEYGAMKAMISDFSKLIPGK